MNIAVKEQIGMLNVKYLCSYLTFHGYEDCL